MTNYIWVIVLIVWIICMLIAASFGMKEDLKDKKNDSSYNLKAAKNFLSGGIIFIVAGIIMLFFTKLVPKFSKVGIQFIAQGIIFLLGSWFQQYKGKTEKTSDDRILEE